MVKEDNVKQTLEEAKLSKIWRRRAIQRAKRHEREYPNDVDKKWALKQQEKWNNENPELEQQYLKELEHAKGLLDSTKEYLNKIKNIRKQRMEAKKSYGVVPFGKNKKPKGTLPSLDVKNKQGPLSKIKRAAKKAKKYGGATYSGGSYGPSGGAPGITEELMQELIDALLD